MANTNGNDADPARPLRTGWTTGTCATAAARAAVEGLWTGTFPDPVAVTLPNGQQPTFALAEHALAPGRATAAIVKDAGDDPDVTHGALVVVTVTAGAPGEGVTFRAGPGVGMVTRPGLPIPPGEPAINPIPRQMIRNAIEEAARLFSRPADIVVEIAIPGGEKIAEKTLNGRLGIVGGLSILGTTGIVVPFSCSAWIHSIHRGIDVALAGGITHVAGSTGATSEAAIARLYGLPDIALIDMGDFAGGMLKYLKTHPVPRVTIAGGFAKMSKLAAGRLDLHSRRGVVDLELIAGWLAEAGATDALLNEARQANTAQQILGLAQTAGIDIAGRIATRAAEAAVRVMSARVISSPTIGLDVVIFDRDGHLAGRSEIVQM
ncbi:MAG: cobalt-precorrin-5B (C(1))-methyltransferase [Hyphomicrobium sp.]